MREKNSLKHRLHEIIYEADTPAGKFFDIALLVFILLSVILVALESVPWIDQQYHDELHQAEWLITIIFTLEYFIRIIAIQKPWRYVFSFFGIIDFLSTIPMYLSAFVMGTQSLVALRALRLLRIFRILKLTRYIGESNFLFRAIRSSLPKIMVFLFGVLILCIIFGTLMYLIETDESGFTSIPRSIYWCIVTLTTVGYGDIAPATALGQFVAALIMIMGYGIIAVPTGIVTSELATQESDIHLNTQGCPNCLKDDHQDEAIYCYHCGTPLNHEE